MQQTIGDKMGVKRRTSDDNFEERKGQSKILRKQVTKNEKTEIKETKQMMSNLKLLF